MIINSESLRAAAVGFKAIFNDALKQAQESGLHSRIATRVDSTNREENYKWLAALPQMREWIGDRHIKNLEAFDYLIRKKDWELTIGVDRDEIYFDALGLVRPRIQEMGNAAGRHYDQLVTKVATQGFTAKGYDGKTFYATDHKIGKTVFGNRGTAAFGYEALMAAVTAMKSITDEAGESLGVVPDTLLVPTALEFEARKLNTAEKIVIGGNEVTNLLRGMFKSIEVSASLATSTEWHVFDTSRAVRPIVLQIVKGADFTALDNPEDHNVFMKKQFLYGVDTMDNAGYGLWQFAYGSTGAGS